jgi:hypothetical protein
MHPAAQRPAKEQPKPRPGVSEPVIFTKERAEAAQQRLVRRSLNNLGPPKDLLEENLIISDMSVYMGYLFELGYHDYESNYKKFQEDLRTAIFQHLVYMQSRRRMECNRKIAAMTKTTSTGFGSIN